jgi:hypothetical protein
MVKHSLGGATHHDRSRGGTGLQFRGRAEQLTVDPVASGSAKHDQGVRLGESGNANRGVGTDDAPGRIGPIRHQSLEETFGAGTLRLRNCGDELDWAGQCLADAERDLSGESRMWPRADRSQDIPDSTAIETRRHRNRGEVERTEP